MNADSPLPQMQGYSLVLFNDNSFNVWRGKTSELLSSAAGIGIAILFSTLTKVTFLLYIDIW